MIESCLYKNPNGRYLDIRQDRIQLCQYDRCAAALMNVFAQWTSWRRAEISKSSERDSPPWVFLSKRQLRYDLLGVFGEPSIERGIKVLEDLLLLQERPPEKIGNATWYLFDYKRANSLLSEIVEGTELNIPKHPNRRKGWLAQRSSFGNNAEGPFGNNAEGPFGNNAEGPFGNNAEGPFGNNAEGASATMPTNRNLKEEPQEIEIPPTPSSENSPEEKQDQHPTSVAEMMSALRRPTKPGRIKGAEMATLLDRLPSLLSSHRASELLTAFESFLQDKYWQERKLPVRAFLSRVNAYLPESTNGAGLLPRPALAAPSEDVQGSPSPKALPGASIDYIARWNELVPEAPADPALLPRRPKSFSEPLFAERFDEICAKARSLIMAGADLKFGFLIRAENGADRYRWQALLADELNWLKPKKSKGRKTQAEEDQEWKDIADGKYANLL